MATPTPAEWRRALAEGRVDLPTCPTCSLPITGWNYEAELLTIVDREPLWPGGPSYPIPGTERAAAHPGPESFTALPCGHVVDASVLTFVLHEPQP